MKATLPFVLSALLFAGCSKSGPDAPPEPASLVGGTWQWSSAQIETKFDDGRPAIVSTQTVHAGNETMTFGADNLMYVAYDGVAQPKVGYQFTNATITYFLPGRTTTVAVSELTAKRMLYTQANEMGGQHTRVTTTYTRN